MGFVIGLLIFAVGFLAGKHWDYCMSIGKDVTAYLNKKDQEQLKHG